MTQQCSDDDGGCQERTATVVEEQQLCVSGRALLDPATEERQMPNPWRVVADEQANRVAEILGDPYSKKSPLPSI